MLISANWIQELVPDLSLSGSELADLLTKHSFETVIEREYVIDDAITVMKIVKLEPHPNADRLRLATITDGSQEIRVVCGAPNISEGDVVPYAPPGSKVYDEEGKLFELTVATIRGVESPGMLNSPRELGISHDHGGIFLLPQDLPLGSKLTDHIQGDILLEVDVLPDRAHDCLSHVGIAKEVAALTRLPFQEPESLPLPQAEADVDGWNVVVEDPSYASRVMGIVMNDISSSALPLPMQVRLLSLGVRPKHPVVDATNYVTFEYGNPSHAYDRDKLGDKTIRVTQTTTDFFFHALDREEYKPGYGDLLIQSGKDMIGLAGVIGGEHSEVDDATKNVFLEIATFNAFRIQEASMHVNLRTEASSRFSKGISPVLAERAAARLAYLISSATGATIQGLIDTNPERMAPSPVPFRPSRVSKYAGIDIASNEAEDILIRIGCSIEKVSADQWEVLPTPERLDLTGEHDLIDEVIRIYGLDAIPASSLAAQRPLPLSEKAYWTNLLRRTLVDAGYTETYGYSFEDERVSKLVNAQAHPHVALTNPMAPELKQLRYSMLPGLISAMMKSRDEVHRTKKGQEKALFEIGRVYHVGDGGMVPGVIERPVVAGISVGDEATLQRTIDAIRELFGIEALEIREAEKPFGEVGTLLYAGEFFGITYKLNQAVLKKMKYRLPVVAFELSINALLTHAKEVGIPTRTLEDITKDLHAPMQFTELPKYPSVFRDISLLVEADTKIDAVEQEIWRIGKAMVVDVDLFDEYQPQEGKKGIAFHIEYRLPGKTLTDVEVDAMQKKIEHALTKEFDAEVR